MSKIQIKKKLSELPLFLRLIVIFLASFILLYVLLIVMSLINNIVLGFDEPSFFACHRFDVIDSCSFFEYIRNSFIFSPMGFLLIGLISAINPYEFFVNIFTADAWALKDITTFIPMLLVFLYIWSIPISIIFLLIKKMKYKKK